MNCTTCNKPLEANARFCPNCGTTVSRPPLNHGTASPIPSHQPASMGEPPTIPPSNQQKEPLILRPPYPPGLPTQDKGATQLPSQPPQYSSAPPQQRAYQPGPQYQDKSATQLPSQSPQHLSAPPQQRTYQPSTPFQPASAAAANANTFASTGNTKPRRRGRGCLVGSLITILLLILLLGGGWFLALRPYLNNTATNKLDSVLTDAVNKIPSQVSLAPAGRVAIPENVLNNLLVLQSSPDDIVKNTQVHITTQAMSLQFQVLGFACTVTGVPKVVQGKLVATNVTVDGIAGLIFSPDEITALANRHFAEAQAKIQHSITSVQLDNQQLILVLGAPGSTPNPGGVPPLPVGSPPTIP